MGFAESVAILSVSCLLLGIAIGFFARDFWNKYCTKVEKDTEWANVAVVVYDNNPEGKDVVTESNEVVANIKYVAPKVEEPKEEAPKTEEPKVETPKEEPKVEVPKKEEVLSPKMGDSNNIFVLVVMAVASLAVGTGILLKKKEEEV